MDVDDSAVNQRRLVDLDRARRVWALAVCVATRDLIALGHRSFTVRLTHAQLSATTTPPLQLRVLGWALSSLVGSSILQVVAPLGDRIPRGDNLVQPGDLVVAVDDYDLLLSVPSIPASRVEEFVVRRVEQQSSVSLRVVRLDGSLRMPAIPTLNALTRLDQMHTELHAAYASLQTHSDNEATTIPLAPYQALLAYGARLARALRASAMNDERVSFAVAFHTWYVRELSSGTSNDQGTEEDANDENATTGARLTNDRAVDVESSEKLVTRSAPDEPRTRRPSLPCESHAPATEPGNLSIDEAQQFLSALVDPEHDLDGAVAQLLAAIETMDAISSMSFEFPIAPGVKLYRSLRDTFDPTNGHWRWHARVWLGHCVAERAAPSKRVATMDALVQLRAALRDSRRLWNGLLDRLRDECGFPQPPQNRDAYRLAQTLTASPIMTVVTRWVRRRGDGHALVDAWYARALIDELVLGEASEPEQPAANARAIHNALVFLSDLVALQTPDHADHATAATRWTSRKRPLDEVIAQSLAALVERPPVRPRRDLSETARDAMTEDDLDAARAMAYRRLVKAVVGSRDRLLSQLESVEWRDDVDVDRHDVAGLFTVEQRVAKKLGRFVCEWRVAPVGVSWSFENEQLAVAARGLLDTARTWLDQLHADWRRIADTYASITRTKRKTNQQQDQSLSAAMETRHHKRLRDVVANAMTRRGAMHECVIRVRGQIAVHRWAVKEKDAKRAANTEFCDLVAWIRAIRH